jgi:hypothetical protein
MLCVEFKTNLFWICEQLYRCISGLGSRLCETMRDEYPTSKLNDCDIRLITISLLFIRKSIRIEIFVICV